MAYHDEELMGLARRRNRLMFETDTLDLEQNQILLEVTEDGAIVRWKDIDGSPMKMTFMDRQKNLTGWDLWRFLGGLVSGIGRRRQGCKTKTENQDGC